MNAQLFEEILHRLPELKTLKVCSVIFLALLQSDLDTINHCQQLILVGPELNVQDSRPVDMDTCP